jgi:trans-aconitate methyltransferase
VTDRNFRALAKEAAARYPARDRYARHFAYGKLTGDPVFEHLVGKDLIPPTTRLLDLGCGQGLVASLLAGARGDVRVTGIDLMEREIARARAAVPEATFIAGDIAKTPFPAADVVLILDVLHYLEPAAQADVLRRVRAALEGGGTLFLRVADESPALRFRYTVLVDRVASALRGHGFVKLHCRPVAAWRSELESLGFRVEALPMSEGTPFANVLLAARYDGVQRRP